VGEPKAAVYGRVLIARSLGLANTALQQNGNSLFIYLFIYLFIFLFIYLLKNAESRPDWYLEGVQF